MTYKTKLFIYFFILFTIFAGSVISFQYQREKEFKTKQLESNLNIYTHTINKYIQDKELSKKNSQKLKDIVSTFPNKDIRVTFINTNGKVLYDNDITNSEKMENHLQRPEIKKALGQEYGTSIRYSTSVGKDYYYYARYFDKYYIRVALPYDIDIQKFLKVDSLYIYFLLFAFIIILFSLIYISDKLGKSISKLKDFAISVANNTYTPNKTIDFPRNELGIIGNKIIGIYNKLSETKEELSQEKEKLIMHLHNTEQGIAIFSQKKEKLFANSMFIQNLNTIIDNPSYDINLIFTLEEFSKLNIFIKENITSDIIYKELPTYNDKLYKNGKYFNIKSIVFQDQSFEITITDETKTEKTKILKQEMTSNIAHELRTPITSIRGYLETIIENKDIAKDKRDFFIERSFNQILRLSDLISDISLITKTEEATNKLELENINIKGIVDNVINDLSILLEENNITTNINISNDIIINGNNILIFSLFRNLLDNTINHGGKNLNVEISNYLEDKDYYYFTYNDNGEGVSEKHLGRLFERFYRADSGRTRKAGGTGLGLSIVKNAVLFHGGEITAKNRKEGGLEFIFTLEKK